MTTLHEIHRPRRAAKRLRIGGDPCVHLPVHVAPVNPENGEAGAPQLRTSLDLWHSIEVVQQLDGLWTDGGGRFFKIDFVKRLRL